MKASTVLTIAITAAVTWSVAKQSTANQTTHSGYTDYDTTANAIDTVPGDSYSQLTTIDDCRQASAAQKKAEKTSYNLDIHTASSADIEAHILRLKHQEYTLQKRLYNVLATAQTTEQILHAATY